MYFVRNIQVMTNGHEYFGDNDKKLGFQNFAAGFGLFGHFVWCTD